jgi:hypothetical protein
VTVTQFASEVQVVAHAVALRHVKGEHDDAAELQVPRPLQVYLVSVEEEQLSAAQAVVFEYRAQAPEPLQNPS